MAFPRGGDFPAPLFFRTIVALFLARAHRWQAARFLRFYFSRLPASFLLCLPLFSAPGIRVPTSFSLLPTTVPTRKPAAPGLKAFEHFRPSVPADRPFCFLYGSRDPHRAYVKGSGARLGMKPERVLVRPFLPDTPEVRGDILDYYLAVQRYDHDVGAMLKLLESSGRAANTIVVMTGDNGWPFPRAKANLYDAGTRLPLAVRWPAKVKGGWTVHDFVSFTDFAPTYLEAAGLKPPAEMTGRSFLGLLYGKKQ